MYLEMLCNLQCSASNHGLGLKYIKICQNSGIRNICLVTSHLENRFINLKMLLFFHSSSMRCKVEVGAGFIKRFSESLNGFRSQQPKI